MKKINTWSVKICFALIFTLILVLMISGCKSGSNEEITKIRIGWQIAWATQGQIAQTLKHTGILSQYGIEGEFFGFTYGAPLSEAALSGQIDIGFAADQPVASLIAAGGKFKIVARLMYFRGGIIVPPDSEIKTVDDLKGKTLAIPFGSTTHRIVLEMLEYAGLDPQNDLNIINLDIAEQASVVLSGNDGKWKGNVDALASWDPNIAVFLDRDLARILWDDLALAVMYMSEELIERDREAAVNFIMAYIESYYHYVSNSEIANQWFADEARIEFEPSLLDIVASFEPNFYANSINEIDVSLSGADYAMMEAGAEFGVNQGMLSNLPDMRSAVDTTLLMEAIDRLNN